MIGIACCCSSPDCRVNGCAIARREIAQYGNGQHGQPWMIPQSKPHGCICPPGSEQTCQGIACPRKNPLAQSQQLSK